MDEKINSSGRAITKRAAYSDLQQVYSSMERSERLVVSLALIYAALKEDDVATVELIFQGSNKHLDEKVAEIQVLAKQLSRKMLIELALDILCFELKT
jgi:hypothetical protein